MNSLIFIALVIGFVVLHSWWNARKQIREQQSGRQDPAPWPGSGSSRSPTTRPGSPPANPSPAANWEEELRRLLEGEPAAPTPTPRPVPPPVLAPPPLPRRTVVGTPTSVPAANRPRTTSQPARVPVPRPVPVPVVDVDMETGLPVKMPSLTESAKAYVRASQLESRVAEQMRRVDRQVSMHAKVESTRMASPEIKQALSLLRTRSSQRAAILASVVLGPPRGLED